MFEIHPQLKRDCILVGKFELSYLMLMNDSNYPWFILVPDREDIKEIFQLSGKDQTELLKEISYLSELLHNNFNADKINVAALGNVVPQLHIHIIVRYAGDPAWPSPVWGKVTAKEYTGEEKESILTKLKALIKKDFTFNL
ncbi:MAG: HIT domain-containing protein [Ignavibacteriaceae bacterium]